MIEALIGNLRHPAVIQGVSQFNYEEDGKPSELYERLKP